MKDKILKLASRILRTGGYEALNFGVIANELNITRANIHYHFKNKKNLALEATAYYMDQVESKFQSLHQKYPADFPSVMKTIDDELWQQLAADDYQGYCICLRLVAEQSWIPKELADKANQHFQRLIEIFTELVEESQKVGNVRVDRSAEDIAREALLIHLGIGLLAMSLPSERKLGSFSHRQMQEWLASIR